MKIGQLVQDLNSGGDRSSMLSFKASFYKDGNWPTSAINGLEENFDVMKKELYFIVISLYYHP
jgi:hypothetical protein